MVDREHLGHSDSRFCELRGHYDHEAAMKRIAEDVKNSAYEIIEKKHATYYGIAMTVKRICEAIARDEKTIIPVSNYQNGEYGLDEWCFPCPPSWAAAASSTKCPHRSTRRSSPSCMNRRKR